MLFFNLQAAVTFIFRETAVCEYAMHVQLAAMPMGSDSPSLAGSLLGVFHFRFACKRYWAFDIPPGSENGAIGELFSF